MRYVQGYNAGNGLTELLLLPIFFFSKRTNCQKCDPSERIEGKLYCCITLPHLLLYISLYPVLLHQLV